MGKIDISHNKSLKLTNVVIVSVEAESLVDYNRVVEGINNYIKSKGASPIGPLIQKTEYNINEEGQIDIHVYLMRQANTYIHSMEAPYRIKSLIRVPDCMYARYVGPEEKMSLAYNKINIVAFEEDIALSNENYTILVDRQEDDIVADVFIRKNSTNETAVGFDCGGCDNEL